MSDALLTFFRLVLGKNTRGHVCLATIDRRTKPSEMRERYFEWPKEEEEMSQWTQAHKDTDVYFCPQMLFKPKRNKESVKYCNSAWADLDSCDPVNCLVRPSIEVESSPGKYQAYWTFEEPLAPEIAESISKRIAYYHKDQGADPSGFDLSQLLRVPMTHNYKYDKPALVKTLSVARISYRFEDFVRYPEARGVAFQDIPENQELPNVAVAEIIEKYNTKLSNKVYKLMEYEPDTKNKTGSISWSEALWRLMLELFEAGMSREEVFAVVKEAKCNKYNRDGRPDSHLWRDVLRAYQRHMENINTVVVPEDVLLPILTPEEEARIKGRRTFVERYIEWASSLGDAAVQYHQAGAFTILSALLAGRVQLPTSYGTLIPNLWFMLLGDTTLTRKSTSMDIPMDLLKSVDPDAEMATDGSIEGLMTGLSMRPNRPSIFLRDEVTGFFEAMTRREYMAGMAEMLTKMYDGRSQKRLLRKETVEVVNPVLIFFGGGIRNRMQSIVTLDHVSSGFLPRFIFLTAVSDVSLLKPLGPPTERDQGNRQELVEELQDIVGFYHVEQEVLIQQTGITIPRLRKWEARLSPIAWQRFAVYERDMLNTGVQSERPEIMTPVYDRLAKSTLKAAVLLAAAEQRSNEVIVEEEHLLHAMYYARTWREYAVDFINGVGKNADERDVERILATIQKKPGVGRSRLMQMYHLTATRAEVIFKTLEQRGLVRQVHQGKGFAFFPETQE